MTHRLTYDRIAAFAAQQPGFNGDANDFDGGFDECNSTVRNMMLNLNLRIADNSFSIIGPWHNDCRPTPGCDLLPVLNACIAKLTPADMAVCALYSGISHDATLLDDFGITSDEDIDYSIGMPLLMLTTARDLLLSQRPK